MRALTHASSGEEEKAIGNLLTQAARFERDVVVLAHPGTDLIDTLDVSVIVSAFRSTRSTHAEADRQWKALLLEGQKLKRKVFYEQCFGIENSRRTYERLGDDHRDRHVRPPMLAAIVDRVTAAAAHADLAALGMTANKCGVASGRRPAEGVHRAGRRR